MTTGWRHVYTWSRRGALGAPGFQTIARSRELGGDRLRALERRVAGLRPPAGVQRPSLFLQPSPTDAGRSVLTRSVATGRSADGRPGGFVAESLVVPDRWLEAAEWDLEAAFEAIPWREWSDAEDAEVVPDEELPALGSPGDAVRREKLARLDRLLPDPEIRAALLETLIWQAEDGGRDEPIHLVADPDTALEDFEGLVLLLPMALRPEERVRAAEGRPGERRSLRLGTLATPGAIDRPDLLGVPDALLEEARRAPGAVLDLGGRIPPPRPGGKRVRERARRVSRELTGEGAGMSEAADDQDKDETGGTSLDGAPRLDEADESNEAHGPGDPDPLAERAALWRLREASEARAAALLDRLREDHDRMLEPLKRLVEAERRRFGDELEGLKRELSEIAGEARAELAREADRERRQLQQEGERRKGVLRDSLGTRIEELDRYQEELLHRLSEEEVRAERRLRDAAGLAATASDRKEPPARRPDRERRDGADRGPLAPRAPAGGAWKSSAAARPSLRERLRDSPAAYRWGVPLALLALLAVAAYFLLWRGGEPASGSPEPASAVAEAPVDDTPRAAELRARALDRLADGATAAALLGAAAQTSEPAVRDLAAAIHLALAMGPAGLVDATESCVLLQQVLSDRRSVAGGEPIAVDGRCGAGTQAVLAEIAPSLGCAGGDWQAQGACVLNRQLSGGEPPCAATWPLRRACGWSHVEGARALDLARETAPPLQARLDLVQSPDLARETAERGPDRDLVPLLPPLAWGAAEAAAGRSVPAVPAAGGLDADQLDAVLAYLDRLGGSAG